MLREHRNQYDPSVASEPQAPQKVFHEYGISTALETWLILSWMTVLLPSLIDDSGHLPFDPVVKRAERARAPPVS